MKLSTFTRLTETGQVTMNKKGQFIYGTNYYTLKSCKNCKKVFVGQGVNNFCDISCSALGENNGMYNKNLTEEHRDVGRATSIYYQWRLAVLKRDNRTCQYCGSQEDLINHHIENYTDNPELRIKVSNGTTLCRICHQEYHHLFGYLSGRDEFEDFMSDSPYQKILRDNK